MEATICSTEGLFLLIHDIIKIKYVERGYLPDFPYHLISDKEMFDAFILSSSGTFFESTYPCPIDFETQYTELITAIKYHITQYLEDQASVTSISKYEIPDWVYSYMLGIVVGPNSTESDRHDLFVLLGMDNIEDEFTSEIYAAIYRISQRWTYKSSITERVHRPPTMFGEPHVIKSLRLDNSL
jgi:hypothetical protein